MLKMAKLLGDKLWKCCGPRSPGKRMRDYPQVSITSRSYTAAVSRAAKEIDHGIGAQSRRQRDLKRGLVVQHWVRGIEKPTHLGFVAKDRQGESEDLGDAREAVTLVGRQGLLVLAPAF